MVNKYYEKYKETLRKKTRERHQNLYEQEKDKRRKKVRDRDKNLPEEKKTKTALVYEKIFNTKSNS